MLFTTEYVVRVGNYFPAGSYEIQSHGDSINWLQTVVRIQFRIITVQQTMSTRTRSSSNRAVENVTHQEMSGSGSASEDQDAQQQLLVISKAVQKQLKQNKRAIITEVTTHAEIAVTEAVKRAFEQRDAEQQILPPAKQAKKALVFKREGNKIRHQVNEDVLGKLEEAVNAIDRNDLEAGKLAIEGGKSILVKQQKLIRLADREEHGWEVVKHYLSDELASDSDDEKAINKARKEALASINKTKNKKKQFRNVPPTNTSTSYERHTKPRFEDRSRYDNKGVACYRCGIFGHMQYDCPRRFDR